VKSTKDSKFLQVRVKAELGFLNDTAPSFFMKKAVHVCLLAETSDGHKVHFCRIRSVLLSINNGDGTSGCIADVFQWKQAWKRTGSSLHCKFDERATSDQLLRFMRRHW